MDGDSAARAEDGCAVLLGTTLVSNLGLCTFRLLLLLTRLTMALLQMPLRLASYRFGCMQVPAASRSPCWTARCPCMRVLIVREAYRRIRLHYLDMKLAAVHTSKPLAVSILDMHSWGACERCVPRSDALDHAIRYPEFELKVGRLQHAAGPEHHPAHTNKIP